MAKESDKKKEKATYKNAAALCLFKSSGLSARQRASFPFQPEHISPAVSPVL